MYISGNLAAETMTLIYRFLKKRKYVINLFSDGYLPEILSSLKIKPKIIDMKKKNIKKFILGSKLIIMGIRSPGKEERSIIDISHHMNIPSIVVLADLGSGSQKFKDNKEWHFPNIITVPDSITYKILVKEGIPKNILFKLGSPYLDNIIITQKKIKYKNNNKIGFFSVPNELDFKTKDVKVYYNEIDVINGLIKAIKNFPKMKITIRLHPKEFHKNPYKKILSSQVKIESLTKRSSINEFISSHSIFISTYSTAMLISKYLCKPTISFQPKPGPIIRKELYEEYKLPVVIKEEDLVKLIRSYIGKQDKGSLQFLYNRKRSLFAFEKLINKTLNQNAICKN